MWGALQIEKYLEIFLLIELTECRLTFSSFISPKGSRSKRSLNLLNFEDIHPTAFISAALAIFAFIFIF
jgi:hypothetical protein